jgi:AraC-like DNA-binding protein
LFPEDRWADSIPPSSITRASAGTIVYSPGGRFGPRLQQDLQLVLLHTGNMEVSIDGVRHAIQPGNVVLLKPGHQEYFSFAEEQETWHRWIAVHPRSLSAETVRELESLPLQLPLSGEMNHLTDLMLSLQDAETWESPLLRSLGYAALMLYISESRRRENVKRTHPAVQLAMQRIRADFARELSLQELSEAAHVTPEHLIRLFRREQGVTPIQYLWGYRVLRSEELLRSTGLSIAEVAERCGFKTSYHFARLVKRYTGKTPTDIRRGAETSSR